MRCNACWRELEGRAISTTCGHLLCTEDASKILNNDAACPICDQVLSKSLMKPVDINPNDEWINMAMAGISPQILMKSAYRSVMFYIGQKELEMQFKMNRIVAQCRQKCEAMQEKFTEKLEQVHTAYQKMAKRCQMMEQEIESLSKDKQELQEKFSEKSRQKRKLDEMYDQLRSEYESMKRSAIQPAGKFYSRNEPDLFSNPVNMNEMDNRDPIRKDWSVLSPPTPGPREDIWPARQNSSNSGTFDISGVSPVKQTAIPVDAGNRRAGAHPVFGAGGSNPSMTLRNLILSPIKRPQLSRNRTQMFTL
ncbi:zf-C3HC4_2 domain-containing protein [Cephalotus follicularis]|uniref:Zf-C3HC4_2 domain-containing protein n=1 Tax=Cephalotus follicularis TaxID=3775 RepID=A0A1Q3AYP0_CEPFO|nr:zf-C3HC4_2 domain-containing protein [Cephalotus follicularis]